MLQLDNRTPFEAERAVLLDLDGSEIWVVAVKATFEFRNGEPVLAGKQEPVCLVDEYYGEPGVSSMRYESELTFRKPGTDVVINGHAYSPGGKPAKELDVVIGVNNRRKVIRVRGDRFWRQSLVGLTASSPQPFEKIPLIYERAFGGTDTSDEDPRKHGAESRNPVGTGFAVSSSALKDRPLPNLEDPSTEIRNLLGRPKPVGIGFICKHWEPRRRYTGTCDQDYIENRLPLYPLDFDLRFFQGANPDWIFTPHLRGGESVELENMTPDGYLAFQLPRTLPGFRTLLSGKWIPHRATLGTVVIEPDVPRVLMTWQTFLPCHRRTFELETTRIFEKRWLSGNEAASDAD
jgi:hypothetical protein